MTRFGILTRLLRFTNRKAARRSDGRIGIAELVKRVAPFVLVIATQSMIATESLHVSSIVRSFVEGESLWSKGQKDAIYFLDLYADTGDELYYRKYLDAMVAPQSYLVARNAMEAPVPDRALAKQAFVRAGHHPDDGPGAVWLYVYFRDFPYLKESVALWKATDPTLTELSALGDRVRAAMTGPNAAEEVRALKARIFQLDEKMIPMGLAFSKSLGAGSRAVTAILTLTNIATSALLAALISLHIRKLLIQRQRFEKALESEKERAQITLRSIVDAVVRVDAKGRVDYMNPAAERLVGVGGAKACGESLSSMVSFARASADLKNTELIGAILGGVDIQIGPETALFLHGAAGVTPISLAGARIELEDGTNGAVVVMHDMTREQEFIGRLSWQASHDTLTGLANRREFEEQLERWLEALAVQKSENALVLIDLDQFKIVNDTCGHAAGDKLLREISALLQQDLRETDLVARLGGDEFGILLKDRTIAQASEIAERLRDEIQQWIFVWNCRTFNISASIGLIPLSTPHTTIQEALGAADIACYMAKEKGRNRVQLHQPSDEELQQRVGEMTWVQRIRDALEENRLCLYAQRIAPVNGEECGEHVELLLRLRDAHDGLISPDRFFPAAERFGMMPLVDRWVVDAAFASLSRRQRQTGAKRIATCAINLSAGSVGDPDFTGYLHRQFRKHDIQPSDICFEITETGAISNLAMAAKFIGEFQQLGCRFSLDDFGTGMSSFGYLKRFPVDYLKIDGSFVRDMLNDRMDRAMVEMVVHMAKTTGKKTVAEYVESDELLEAVRAIGVDYAQGYAIGRPEKFSELYAPPVWRPTEELPTQNSTGGAACWPSRKAASKM